MGTQGGRWWPGGYRGAVQVVYRAGTTGLGNTVWVLLGLGYTAGY